MGMIYFNITWLILFDMGFFEPSVMGGGGLRERGHEGPAPLLSCYCSDDTEIWNRYQAEA